MAIVVEIGDRAGEAVLSESPRQRPVVELDLVAADDVQPAVVIEIGDAEGRGSKFSGALTASKAKPARGNWVVL